MNIQVYSRTPNTYSCKISGDTYKHREALRKLRFIWLGGYWDSTVTLSQNKWSEILQKAGINE